MELSKENILKIAEVEAVKLGFTLSDINMKIDSNNIIWKTYISNNIYLENNPNVKSRLENRTYYAVYLEPKNIGKVLGGDGYLFIDKYSGEVILYIRGK